MGATLDRARRLFAMFAHDEAVAVVVHDERCLQQRREDREPTGRGPHTIRCPSCYRFKTGLQVTCGCGWSPHGGWSK